MKRKASLHGSAESGDHDDVRRRLSLGENVNQLDEYYTAALHYAANKGRFAIAEMLLQAGADFNAIGQQGRTPLHNAANKGHLEIVQILIEYGADLNIIDSNGQTALHIAQTRGRENVYELLRALPPQKPVAKKSKPGALLRQASQPPGASPDTSNEAADEDSPAIGGLGFIGWIKKFFGVLEGEVIYDKTEKAESTPKKAQNTTALWDRLSEDFGRQLVDERAKVLVEQGLQFQNESRYNDAIKVFKSAIAIEPKYVDPHHFIAITYGLLKQYENALVEYKNSLNLAENFLPYKIRKSTIENILTNFVITINAFKIDKNDVISKDFIEICQTLKSPPPIYHFFLGQIYSYQKRFLEAIKECEVFLSKDKDGEITNDVVEKIKGFEQKAKEGTKADT